MKSGEMKQAWVKLTAAVLSVLMMLGGLSPIALAENAGLPVTSEAEMQAMIDAYWADGEQEGIFQALALGALKYLGGKIGSKIEEQAWGKVWNTVFGDKDAERHRELMNKLIEIEAKLDKIIGMLTEMRNDVRMKPFHDSIQRKLNLAWEVKNQMNNRVTEFEGAKTMQEKYDALDKWFNMKVAGQADSIDYLTYYCGMVVNREGMNLDGPYFEQYKKYSDLKWSWELEGIPFRQMQMEKDLMLIAKMTAMNMLWIAKEKKLHPEKENLLAIREKQMKDAVQWVVDACEKYPIEYTENLSEMHYDGRSMTIYVGKEGYNSPLSIGGVFRENFVVGGETHGMRRSMEAYCNRAQPDSKRFGTGFHLITRDELKLLLTAATGKDMTIKEFITAHGQYPNFAALEYITFASERNQPISFGKPGGFANSYRFMYFENANITVKGKSETNTKVCYVSTEVTDKDRFNEPPKAGQGRYKVIKNQDDNTQFFEKTLFYPIWVMDAGPYPTVEALEEALDDAAGTVSGVVSSAEDGVLALLWEEKNALVSMAYDEGTAFAGLDGETVLPEQLVDAHVTVDYENPGGEVNVTGTDAEGLAAVETPYRLARVTAMERPAPVPETVEAPFARLETTEQIIGRNAQLVLDMPGGEMRFDVPHDVGIPEGLEAGMTLRVTYHLEGGVNVADGVERVEGPDERLRVEGEVIHLDVVSEILGLPPTLIVASPGGSVTLAMPQGLPEEVDEGAQVAAEYHVENGKNLVDDLQVLARPAPTPDDPMPGPVPNPNPDDPMPGPVPNPTPEEHRWVEGYIMERVDDAAGMMPGELRRIAVAAAGQTFELLVPMDMELVEQAQVGAFVHVDYVVDANGRNVMTAYVVLEAAPMPGPVEEEPMPGPVDWEGEFEAVVVP